MLGRRARRAGGNRQHGRLGVRVRIWWDAERDTVAGHRKGRCSQQGFLEAWVPDERGRCGSSEALEGGRERCAEVADHPLDER